MKKRHLTSKHPLILVCNENGFVRISTGQLKHGFWLSKDDKGRIDGVLDVRTSGSRELTRAEAQDLVDLVFGQLTSVVETEGTTASRRKRAGKE